MAYERICPRCRHRFEVDANYCPFDGQPALKIDACDDPRAGQPLGDTLTLLGLLGMGGMGAVYRALQHSMEREVAVKLLQSDYTTDEQAVKRFLREAKGVSRLTHPNSISVFDFGRTDDGEFFLVMELLKGSSLRDVMVEADGPLPVERVRAISSQVLDALDAAHALKIVHRDIKPENIFVLPGPQHTPDLVKVIDFGVAKIKATPGLSTLTKQGVVLGSPKYMSPEQGLAKRVDGRTDIYAFAVIVFEMLTGRLPYSGETPMEHLVAHIRYGAQSLSDARPDLPPALDQVLAQALSKDPERRPATAEAFKAALEQAFDGGPFDPAATMVSSAPPKGPADESFVGRGPEIERLFDLFTQRAQVVTIVGAGGMGKTRLATTFLAQWTSTRGPVQTSMCDLSYVTTAEGLCLALSQELGGTQDTAADLVSEIGKTLARQGDMVVLLDGYEQVAHSGSHPLSTWMEMAPAASFLVTSRQKTGVPGEHVLALAPLGLPKGDARSEVMSSEAARLFVARAKSHSAALDLASENTVKELAALVTKLEGWPLALELAAARLALFGTKKLLKRLSEPLSVLSSRDGQHTRHGTLRNTIAWSWQLLDSAEQATLAQLSVFCGGFSVESAEAVVDLSGIEEPPWVVDVIESLKDKSMVSDRPGFETDEPRLGLYDPIAEFARERLVEGAEDKAARDRHSAYFLSLAWSWAQAVEEPGGSILRKQLALERENLVAVLLRALDEQPPTADAASRALWAVVALEPLLATSGPLRLYLMWLDAALEKAEGVGAAPWAIARALKARGEIRRVRGDLVQARSDIFSALHLARQGGQKKLEGRLLHALGMIAITEGRLDQAIDSFQGALAIEGQQKDRFGQGHTLGSLGYVYHWLGRLDDARQSYKKAEQIFAEAEDDLNQGTFLGARGVAEQEAKNLPEARALLEKALAIVRQGGGRRWEGIFWGHLGMLAWESGNQELARHNLDKALETLAEVEDIAGQGFFVCVLAALDALEGKKSPSQERFDRGETWLSRAGPAGYVGAARVLRGFLDLLLSRQARVSGDEHLAAQYHASARRRVSEAESRGPKDDAHPQGSPPLASQNDDVRFALRMIRRALG